MSRTGLPRPDNVVAGAAVSAYMLVDGIAEIISAVLAIRQKTRWGFLIFAGLLNIAVGIGAFL